MSADGRRAQTGGSSAPQQRAASERKKKTEASRADSALEGQAHLYLATCDDWTRGDLLAKALALLSPAERARYERFRVEPPARAFATARALARQVLSLYAEREPASWHLEPDEHGRPRIVDPAEPPRLEFNLSHTDRLVACLVTADVPCGVDVESLDRRVDPVRIAEHSFGEDEVRDLKSRQGTDRRRRFFTYWTLKEAYLKARGRGIAMRMDSALFRFPADDADASIAVDFAPRTGDRPGDWRFAVYRVEGEQLLALAVRPGSGENLEIRSFRAQPGEPRAAEVTLELERSNRRTASSER